MPARGAGAGVEISSPRATRRIRHIIDPRRYRLFRRAICPCEVPRTLAAERLARWPYRPCPAALALGTRAPHEDAPPSSDMVVTLRSWPSPGYLCFRLLGVCFQVFVKIFLNNAKARKRRASNFSADPLVLIAYPP
jgi:hypothetical protein